jgi:serine/threonine protein kinase
MRQIGRYQLLSELGRGGMGVVYEAVDPLIGRNIALKTIDLQSLAGRESGEFLRERLFREARSAGMLVHPGIVIIYDVGQQGDSAFIAMELVKGPTLLQRLDFGPKPNQAEIIEILRQTAAALDYAHANGVIHRDVKPANIILRDGATVKVADFGIAKITETLHHTQTGVLLGTPSYMSPEQIEGHTAIGRSDQFSLAVIAFEMLTGVRPFQADSLAGMVHRIVYEERPSLRAVNPSLTAAADKTVRNALARDPAERYESCGQFVEALEVALDTVMTTSALSPVFIQTPSPAARKNRTWTPFRLLMAASAGLILILAALVYKALTPTPPIAARQAEPPVPPTVAAPAKPKKPASSARAMAPPKIARFRAEPATVKRGKLVRLAWKVVGASHVSIDHGLGAVAPEGFWPFLASSTTTYTLSAEGKGGAATSRVTVTVLDR